MISCQLLQVFRGYVSKNPDSYSIDRAIQPLPGRTCHVLITVAAIPANYYKHVYNTYRVRVPCHLSDNQDIIRLLSLHIKVGLVTYFLK